jgi:quinol monooxygenase YgiN
MVKVIAKSYAKEASLTEILELSKEMVEKTALEKGCIKYELYQDVKEPCVLIFLEEWESEAALNDHMASEHFTRLIPQINKLREKASEVTICKKLF